MVLLALMASPALAWQLSKTTNGVVIERETSDSTTNTASYTIYYDYKGVVGNTYDSAYSPRLTTSYSQNTTTMAVFDSAGQVSSVEIPLVANYRVQLVTITGTVTGTKSFVILSEPLKVSLPSTQSVSVSNWPTSTVVSSMPTMSLASSVSVAGTLPVSVVGTDGAVFDAGLHNTESYVIAGIAAIAVVGVVIGIPTRGRRG